MIARYTLLSSVCLSVCPSRAGIVPKPLNVCGRLFVDFVPEEHRHLPGDVFRDGLLDAARVRRRLVSRQSQVEASSGADRRQAAAPIFRLHPAACRQRRGRRRLPRADVADSACGRDGSEVLPEVRE